MSRFLLLALLNFSLYASDINWFDSYIKAQKSAETQSKPILVFMNRAGCGSCAYMKKNVFTDPDIVSYLNKHYISVSLDINKNDAPENLQVSVTPVFHFLRSDGTKSIETLLGGKTAPFFLKLLKKADTPAR